MDRLLRLPRIRVRTPVKKVLSIAIRYSHLHDQGFELEHAHEDSKHIIDLAIEENITVLKDCDGNNNDLPTRENILQAMHDLVANSMKGDHLICHISGHGSQRPCPTPEQEKDGMDEVFWPVDVEFRDDGIRNYILDDEIKDILIGGVQPGVSLLIVDCCHSGTMADLPHGHSDHMPRNKGFRFEGTGSSTAPLEIGEEPNSAITEPDEIETIKRLYPHVVCWSACKDDQQAYSAGQDPMQTHEQLLHEVSEKIDQLIARYKASSKRDDTAAVVPPRPHLSSLSCLTEIHGVPIRKAFGRSLRFGHSVQDNEIFNFNVVLSPVAACY
ncbi:caspase domain-containing protein [Irpex lacteus]|nr:caspase domain-containing protein [Irpex lacteus]